MRPAALLTRTSALLVALTLLVGCTAATQPGATPVTPSTTPPPSPPTATNSPTPPPSTNGWVPADPTPQMASYDHPAPAHRTRYTLDITVDPVQFQLKAHQTVHVTNNEATDLPTLVFHLFPNAPYFQQEQAGTPLIRPGLLQVDQVQVGSDAVSPLLKEEKEILEVPLPKPLPPGQSVDLTLNWHEAVPSVNDRFGVMGSGIYLGNFYPILAVHDQGGWHVDKYIHIGDPFYSEVADYNVTFTVPKGYTVAATGHYDPPVPDGANTRYQFTAANVRDFAAAASAQWQAYEADVDGIHVRYFRDTVDTHDAPPKDILSPEAALKTITGSLHFYNQKWGQYPYADFTVVDHSGMEYPQFIMAMATMHVIPHEIAHQWWYGVVGNDEVRQIWDEGITEFSSMYYKATLPGAADRAFQVGNSEAMNKSLYMYVAHRAQHLSYASSIYGRGWMLWESLREAMGTAAFEQMLRDFYTAHKFGVATWDDWRQAIGNAAGDKGLAIFDTYVTKDDIPANAPRAIAQNVAP